MLIYANQFHGCCHITLLSNETGEILLFLRCLADSPVVPKPNHSATSHRSMASVRGGFARNRGKGGGEGDVCAVMCPLKEKTV